MEVLYVSQWVAMRETNHCVYRGGDLARLMLSVSLSLSSICAPMQVNQPAWCLFTFPPPFHLNILIYTYFCFGGRGKRTTSVSRSLFYFF